jgi:predicted Zn-dependent protease
VTTTEVETRLDVAARVLDLVRAAAGPGAEAEAYVEHHALSLTRFANSYIHQNVAEATTRVRLRLHLDGRTAVGSTTLADGLGDLVRRTVAASRLSPPDPGWPGLAPPDPADRTGTVDEATADATPAERAARVRAFVAAAGGLPTAGYVRTSYLSAAFANTAGQALAGAATEAGMDGIARAVGSDGVARRASVRLSDLDGAILGARAAAKARAGVDAVELPPGAYEVVLEPEAVGDLVANMCANGFNGKDVAERRSFIRPGETQFDPAVSMVAGGGFGLPFDLEGTPKRRYDLVRDGVTGRPAHDRRTAAQLGTVSTGNAAPTSTRWGPAPRSVTLLPADSGAGAGSTAASETGSPAGEAAGPAADASVLALVSGVRRGLLVTDFWYTRVLDPRPLVITGLTRNGVWLIENGEITTPVRNFRFTQAYPQAVAPGNVVGIGGHAVPQPASWGIESYATPALRLASWNFTGGASG